jgi:hypothetical protein
VSAGEDKPRWNNQAQFCIYCGQLVIRDSCCGKVGETETYEVSLRRWTRYQEEFNGDQNTDGC